MALKDSYLSLITSQHKDKPKFAATVSKLLQYSEDVFIAAVYLDDEFDFELAEGSQQDILGDVIGSFRTLDFAFGEERRSVLNNDEYRVLQRAKIIKNHWNGKIEDLYEKWMLLFGTPIQIKDNQDMTLDIKMDIDESTEMKALMKFVGRGLIVPKPQSIRFKYQFKYPDIILPIKIHHQTSIQQPVNARHCFWNLGNVDKARWDGEFPADGTIRGTGIRPDSNYQERQYHAVAMQMYTDAKHRQRWYNIADGSVVADGSHFANGSKLRGLVEHAVTFAAVKNNIEGEATPI